MRIMSNNTITREEISNTLSEMDAKQNKQIKTLSILTGISCSISVVALILAIVF